MDRKETITFLRRVKNRIAETDHEPEVIAYIMEACDVAICSMEKLEEVQAWLQAQEAGFLAGDAGATKREKV